VTDFKLRRPCAKCPFRTDVDPYLRGARAREIATDLANGNEFACHQTTTYVEDTGDGESDMVAGEGAQFCAGALIMMEHQDAPNQIMRIAERLGAYDPAKLDMNAPVHASSLAFIRHHAGEEEFGSYETCSVVEADCLAPAGMLVGGVVVDCEPEGEVHSCEDCGEPVCDNCAPHCYCKDTGEDG
jgi:hypothetical protein